MDETRRPHPTEEYIHGNNEYMEGDDSSDNSSVRSNSRRNLEAHTRPHQTEPRHYAREGTIRRNRRRRRRREDYQDEEFQENIEQWQKYILKMRFSRAISFNYALLGVGMLGYLAYALYSTVYVGYFSRFNTTYDILLFVFYALATVVGFSTVVLSIVGIVPMIQYYKGIRIMRRVLLVIFFGFFIIDIVSLFFVFILMQNTIIISEFAFLICFFCFAATFIIEISSATKEKEFLSATKPDLLPEELRRARRRRRRRRRGGNGNTVPPPPPRNDPLPPNWEEKYDPTYQRYYYINHEEQHTQWQDPRIYGLVNGKDELQIASQQLKDEKNTPYVVITPQNDLGMSISFPEQSMNPYPLTPGPDGNDNKRQSMISEHAQYKSGSYVVTEEVQGEDTPGSSGSENSPNLTIFPPPKLAAPNLAIASATSPGYGVEAIDYAGSSDLNQPRFVVESNPHIITSTPAPPVFDPRSTNDLPPPPAYHNNES